MFSSRRAMAEIMLLRMMINIFLNIFVICSYIETQNQDKLSKAGFSRSNSCTEVEIRTQTNIYYLLIIIKIR